jgi:hypothetical protein
MVEVGRPRKRNWTQAFPVSLRQAWILGTGLIAAALLIWFVAATIPHYEPWTTIANQVASALFTIGGVAFLYEFAAKTAFASELMGLVELRDHVIASGFERVSAPNDVTWSEVLENSSFYELLVLDPNTRWDWQTILQVARERQTTIRVFMLNPQSQHLPAASISLLTSVEALGSQLNNLARLIEDSWKADRDSGRLATGSTVAVMYFDAVPSCSAIVTDRHAILQLEGLLGRSGRESGRSISFRPIKGDSMTTWLAAQFSLLGNGQFIKFVGDSRPEPQVTQSATPGPAPPSDSALRPGTGTT